MNDREFNEIMQKYVQSTRPNKDIALKKLNQMPESNNRPRKRIKPQFICAAVMCSIILVLCIALPVTLIDNSPARSVYYGIDDTSLNMVESIDVLKNEFRVDAKYPNVNADVVYSVSSNKSNLIIGALLEFWVFDVKVFNAEFVVVPKSYILEKYENYFDSSVSQQWDEYIITSNKIYDFETM